MCISLQILHSRTSSASIVTRPFHSGAEIGAVSALFLASFSSRPRPPYTDSETERSRLAKSPVPGRARVSPSPRSLFRSSLPSISRCTWPRHYPASRTLVRFASQATATRRKNEASAPNNFLTRTSERASTTTLLYYFTGRNSADYNSSALQIVAIYCDCERRANDERFVIYSCIGCTTLRSSLIATATCIGKRQSSIFPTRRFFSARSSRKIRRRSARYFSAAVSLPSASRFTEYSR